MNVVDAMQVPYAAAPGELERIARWCGGTWNPDPGTSGVPAGPGITLSISDGGRFAGPGWWIVRDGGGFTVMSPGLFEALHDEVTL